MKRVAYGELKYHPLNSAVFSKRETPWVDPLGVLLFLPNPRVLTPPSTYFPILRFDALRLGFGATRGSASLTDNILS